MATSPVPIRSQPGVQRDGTRLDSGFYIDAQWCRFQRGLPRKMGGFQRVSASLDEVPYGIHSYSVQGTQYLHVGSASELNQIGVSAGVETLANDRTPVGLVASTNNVWQFDAMHDVNLGQTAIVAHAAPNLGDIDADDTRSVWFGALTASTPLSLSALDPTAGGVLIVGNRLVVFDVGGRVQWSPINNVNAIDSEAFVTQQKLVKGLRFRGGGLPAALLWSLDSLIMMTLNPSGTPTWNFDTLSDSISVLSTRGIIEYDGIYMWAGTDRFQMFNGVVRDLPNDKCLNWFYDNLNYSQRQKVFSYKVPRFGEVWWCYPRDSAEECTHAVVYNVRENTWYDTELPALGRSDGVYAKVYSRPFMTSAVAASGAYELYQHETGVDSIRGASINAIPSWFETHEITMLQAGDSRTIHVARVEPDFVQSGDLVMTVRGRNNARAPVVESDPFVITETAASGDEETVPLKETRRFMSFKFESNEQGGDYQMGNTVAHLGSAGGRVTT